MNRAIKITLISAGTLFALAGVGATCLIGYLSLHARAKTHQTMEAFQDSFHREDAKALLGTLRMLEGAFQAKLGFYTTDLSSLELVYPNALELLTSSTYQIGFTHPSTDNPKKDVRTSPGRMLFDGKNLLDLTSDRVPAAIAGKCDDCTADKSHFKAFAMGFLRKGDPSSLDIWTINEKNKLVHLVDGAKMAR